MQSAETQYEAVVTYCEYWVYVLCAAPDGFLILIVKPIVIYCERFCLFKAEAVCAVMGSFHNLSNYLLQTVKI